MVDGKERAMPQAARAAPASAAEPETSPVSGKASIPSAGFTPGPWVRSTFGVQVLTGDSWNTICTLHSGTGERWRDHRLASWEDGRAATDPEANARLIAAAPALYEALDNLARAADACDPRYEDESDRVQTRVNEAFAALAQARGEQ